MRTRFPALFKRYFPAPPSHSVILYQIGQKKQTLFRPFLKKFSENRRFIKRVVSFPIVFYSNLILSSERQVESSAYKAR
ncbi:MAG TPA: hypothetical protein DCE65_06740, partial [Clostridiales bacterium]|nr:hypothetical protein [Clostridiales bacterium]